MAILNTILLPPPERIDLKSAGVNAEKYQVSFRIPSEALSIATLSELLLGIEGLLSIGAISVAPKLSGRSWIAGYYEFVPRYLLGLYTEHFSPRDSYGIFQDITRNIRQQPLFLEDHLEVALDLFCKYLRYRLSTTDADVLVIEDIRPGSYDILLNAANLAAIFCLQDFSLIKDCVQFALSAIQNAISEKSSNSIYKPIEAPISKMGNVCISPDLVRALQSFDEVRLVENSDSSATHISLHLIKRTKDSSSGKIDAF